MKINEIEELLNIPRANIRYYEKEGLISISRKENGYRNYTEEDIAILKKIIVFRKLGIPIEKIKDLLNGDAELPQVLDESIKSLEKQIEELKGAIEVSKEIRQNRISTNDLDETYYWNLINEKESNGQGFLDIWHDFLGLELSVWDTMWKRVFFRDIKKDRKQFGLKNALILLVIGLFIRGLSRKFLWGGSFWEGFLYPLGLFFLISIVIIPLFLIEKKYPKVAKVISTVIFYAGCIFLAGILLLLVALIIRRLFFM